MIFADKLIQLRKKNGWSQEELAEQMQVTRQAVSKWEGAQSVPDLEKMLRLSALFGVSTDYLLKDELEEPEPAAAEDAAPLRRVTMEEAAAFLDVKQSTSGAIAVAVLLCILSPVCLLVLAAVNQAFPSVLSENVAGGVGLIVLLAMVTAAVAIFMRTGAKTAPFAHLQTEAFETEYGVSGMVKQRQEAFKPAYDRGCILGVCTCILSVLPLLGSTLFSDGDGGLVALMVALLLVLVAIGVLMLLRVGIVWAGFHTLLQEGDYTRQRKASQPLRTGVSVAFWLTATAVYLAYSFATDRWETTWIVWPVAGVLYPALMALLGAFRK